MLTVKLSHYKYGKIAKSSTASSATVITAMYTFSNIVHSMPLKKTASDHAAVLQVLHLPNLPPLGPGQHRTG